ncbi:hypothetical protein [Acinetobacter indicus]|uniref:hypothetical protein n=1 Tax=Acinetobacter indicus TaxID=756892 RepID=UPI002E2FC408|nr:hypothetical protein [Acinetobacter indicus]
MDYKKLEELYDAFVEHKCFSEIEQQAEKILQDQDLDEQNRKTGNWVYNYRFWNNYLITPRGLLTQTENRFSVEVDSKIIDLNSTEAPNFRDKDRYLAWLHQAINK